MKQFNSEYNTSRHHSISGVLCIIFPHISVCIMFPYFDSEYNTLILGESKFISDFTFYTGITNKMYWYVKSLDFFYKCVESKCVPFGYITGGNASCDLMQLEHGKNFLWEYSKLYQSFHMFIIASFILYLRVRNAFK